MISFTEGLVMAEEPGCGKQDKGYVTVGITDWFPTGERNFKLS